MRKTVVRLALMGAALSLGGIPGQTQTATSAAGHWQGKVQIPDREQTIAIDLALNANGKWIGTIAVASTALVDVPLSDISVDGAAVKFAASLPDRATFTARLSADGNSLSGTASNMSGDAPFQLTRSGEANVKLPPPSSPLTKEFAGSWEGTIDSNGKVRRVAMKLTAAADGTANAVLVALDQGNLEIAVNSVIIKGQQLDLQVRAISGKYHGTLGPAGEIAGELTQGQTTVPLTFKRTAAPNEPRP